MKRNLLRTFMVLLAIAAATIGPARGQNSTSSLVFETKYSTGGATADDNVVWTVTSDGAESNFNMDRGIHYGTGSATVGYIELSTSGITGTITQVVVNASTASSVNNATVSVTVGGNAFGTTQSMSSNNTTDYTFTGSASGAIVVRVAKPSAATGALYVMSIEVTYTPAPAVPHTVRFASGNDGWTVQDVTASASATAPAVLENVMAGDSLVVTAPATLPGKVKSVKAVKYVTPMNEVPMTIEALTDGTIKVTAPKSGMKYSLNGGEKIALTVTVFIDVNAGDKVALYGTATSYNGTRTNDGTAEVKVYGNIMSLIDEENYPTATELTAINTFANLFKDNSALTDASGLVLPATTLTTGCYQGLFQNCTSLTQAPAKLPATALANSCYKNMFRNTGLVTVPADLMTDAVVMARESCLSMFRESANLTTAPAITVTTMAAQSCNAMFYHCTSLTSVSALPATTLVNGCYKSMFYSCSSLSSMTCLATSDLNADYCTEDWVNGAGTNATGTKVFTAYGNWVNWSTGNSGIPTGWTRHNLVEVW